MQCRINTQSHIHEFNNQKEDLFPKLCRVSEIKIFIKNALFWDVTPCGCCKNWCFGGPYRLHHQDDKILHATLVFIIIIIIIINVQRTLSSSMLSRQHKLWMSSGTLYYASVASYCEAIPSSLILVTLMMEAILSTEMSVLRIATRCNIPEDGLLHSHCCEDLKSWQSVN
jgi:hypothetical protein